MSVKLKDIAEKANVSISTVSRVINNDKNKPASKETTDKIWAIVRELGYIPNQTARDLIKGENNIATKTANRTICCIYTSTRDTYNDPFFSHIGAGVQEEANRSGYVIAYSLSTYEMSFSTLYKYIVTNPVDGVVVMGRFSKDTLDFINDNFKNVIYAGVNYVNGGFDEVICDGYKGASHAVNYLLEQGYDNVGFIGELPGESKSRIVNEHRYEAYIDTISKRNLPIVKEHIIDTELNSSAAYKSMKKYLDNAVKDNLPQAFYCANDVTAIGAMKAIKEGGYRIPEDIGIIGLDDIEMASFVTPSLTTVRIPKKELGITAVKILIDKIESRRTYPLRVDIPFELVIRDSVKRKSV